MGAETAAILGQAGIGAGASLGGGTNGFSNTFSNASGSSFGNSWENSSSSASGYGYTNLDSSSWAKSIGEQFAEAYGANGSITYGREASAQDLYNAALANTIQADMWQNQAKYNAEQAAIARAWEEKMSNTSYQRAVADLKAAGLNPVLAAMNLGASTPAAISASSGLASAAKANAYAQSESYGYNKSSSYGYNKGSSGSETHSRSENWNSSHSSSSGGSHNESQNKSSSNSHSEQTTQLKSLIDGVKTIFGNANSGKKAK